MRKISTSQFIEKAVAKHGDKYDYSKTKYTSAKTKVIITCPEHGDFLQTPNNHTSGNGCPTCSGNAKLTTYGFIEKARNVHGDKYDYSESECVSYISKIKIKCPTHGLFMQNYDNHLSGRGCRKCGTLEMRKKQRKTVDDFILQSRELHGDNYNYGSVEYVNHNRKVNIECKSHGLFLQTPASHLRGSGCPSCATTCFDSSKPCKLYILVDGEGDKMKIGITSNMRRRMVELRMSTPFTFETLEYFDVEGCVARLVENVLHCFSTSLNLEGFNGSTEWFRYNGDVIRLARQILS